MSEINSIKKELQKLVLQRLEMAFNRLSVILNETDRSGLFSDYILLHSQHNDNRRKLNTGLVNNSQFTEEKNRIRKAVIDLIDELRDEHLIQEVNRFPHTSASEMPWEVYWDQIEQVISTLRSAKTYKPDVMIGITNGGLLLADTIGRIMYPETPIICLWANRFDKNNEYFHNPYSKYSIALLKGKNRILVTDDLIGRATTFVQVRKFLTKELDNIQISYLPLFTNYHNDRNIQKVVDDTIWKNPEIVGVDTKDSSEVFDFLKTEYSHFPYEKIIRPIKK